MTERLIKSIISEILFNNRICESVDDKWIINYLYDNLLCEKLLYGEPITVPELRALLRQKILNFEFIKLDGEVRPAKGTTLMKYIPTFQHPKGIRPSSPKVATFYDLMKKDWRSVSEKSKEIVLKKSEETGKPIVMVKDKSEPGDIAVKEPIEKTEIEPEVKPEVPLSQIKNVKPIESTDKIETFYFINNKTGASKEEEMTAKDVIQELKRLGPGWELSDKENIEKEKEAITTAYEEKPDILKIGDRRNYLNRKGENVEIIIMDEDPYGGYYAKTPKGGLFKIPENRMQNIGELISNETKLENDETVQDNESIIDKLKNKTNINNIEADEL